MPRVKTRGIKLTAMAAITVLALTGFSTGRSHGTSRHGSGGHGGGCSSSSQRQNGSSASDDDDDYRAGYERGYRSGTNGHHTSGSGSAASETGSGSGRTRASTIKATLVSCVTADRPWSTVRLRNTGSRADRYTGSVTFYDKDGAYVDLQGIVDVSVARGKTKTVKVKPLDPQGIEKCELTDEEDF